MPELRKVLLCNQIEEHFRIHEIQVCVTRLHANLAIKGTFRVEIVCICVAFFKKTCIGINMIIKT